MQAGGATVYGLRECVFARFDKRPEDFWEPPKEEEDAVGAELSAGEDEPAFLWEEAIEEQDP